LQKRGPSFFGKQHKKDRYDAVFHS
jgi:hypothetical protein